MLHFHLFWAGDHNLLSVLSAAQLTGLVSNPLITMPCLRASRPCEELAFNSSNNQWVESMLLESNGSDPLTVQTQSTKNGNLNYDVNFNLLGIFLYIDEVDACERVLIVFSWRSALTVFWIKYLGVLLFT